jgi:protease II
MNLWVAPVARPSEARALTDEPTRPIPGFFWAPDSSALLYLNDMTGDEHFQLYKVGLEGLAPQRNNTLDDEPFDRVGAEDIDTTAPIAFSADGTTLYWQDSRGRDTGALRAQDVASGRSTLLAQSPKADLYATLDHPTTGRLTMLDTLPPYWAEEKAVFYARMGNPTTPEGRQMLQGRSPLNKAQAITKPLLIAQGANAPRVKQAESDRIVEAMATRHIPVTYLLFPDEGLGFVRPANGNAFGAITERFLSTCMGGPYEPMGNALKDSSMTAPYGARFIPGLEKALNRGKSD